MTTKPDPGHLRCLGECDECAAIALLISDADFHALAVSQLREIRGILRKMGFDGNEVEGVELPWAVEQALLRAMKASHVSLMPK